MIILISVFFLGYHGKTIDFEKYSPCHRITTAHFLNKGKWDGTISSKTKPSSQALYSNWRCVFPPAPSQREAGLWRWGSCRTWQMRCLSHRWFPIFFAIAGIRMATSWTPLTKRLLTIGVVTTNRVLYLPAWHKAESRWGRPSFAEDRCGCQPCDSRHRGCYVCRYKGSLNGIKNAVVLSSYSKEVFHVPKALWVFISTDISLSTREILNKYGERWPVEVFFR